MGLVYLPTWMVDFYGKYVGKYTIHGSFGTLSGEGESVIKSGDSREGEVGSWMFFFWHKESRHEDHSRPVILAKDLPVIIPNESNGEPMTRAWVGANRIYQLNIPQWLMKS